MKDFVPHEESLALKELGFDEPCFGWWFIDDEMLIEEKSKKVTSENIAQAPTYSQAFRWFREKYMLSGAVIPTTINHLDNTMEYTYDIRGKYTTCVLIGTYEEAELACLRKLIEIVKSKYSNI